MTPFPFEEPIHRHHFTCFVNSAQKLGVPVDSLVLSPGESSFLQQASLITGGIYLRPKDQRAVTQLLLHHYLPSNHSRKTLASPTQVCSFHLARLFSCAFFDHGPFKHALTSLI